MSPAAEMAAAATCIKFERDTIAFFLSARAASDEWHRTGTAYLLDDQHCRWVMDLMSEALDRAYGPSEIEVVA